NRHSAISSSLAPRRSWICGTVATVCSSRRRVVSGTVVRAPTGLLCRCLCPAESGKRIHGGHRSGVLPHLISVCAAFCLHLSLSQKMAISLRICCYLCSSARALDRGSGMARHDELWPLPAQGWQKSAEYFLWVRR